MQRGTISATTFALASIAAAVLSGRIVGTGMWGTLMVIGGAFVGLSPHVPVLKVSGRAVALLAGVLCALASGIGLLAATVGGGFRLPADQGLLLGLLILMAVTGIGYFRSRPRLGDIVKGDQA